MRLGRRIPRTQYVLERGRRRFDKWKNIIQQAAVLLAPFAQSPPSFLLSLLKRRTHQGGRRSAIQPHAKTAPMNVAPTRFISCRFVSRPWFGRKIAAADRGAHGPNGAARPPASAV